VACNLLTSEVGLINITVGVGVDVVFSVVEEGVCIVSVRGGLHGVMRP
jgi:hypothetical protein